MLALFLIFGLCQACERKGTDGDPSATPPRRGVPTQTRSQPPPAPFTRLTFQTYRGDQRLELISTTECEYTSQRLGTILGTYSDTDTGYRTVVSAFGTQQVTYYMAVPGGLRANDGTIFLNPQALLAAREQERLAEEEKRRLRQEEEDRKRNEQRKKVEALTAKKESHIAWFRAYFAKGQSHSGKYYVRGGSNAVYPFVMTATEEPEISDNGAETTVRIQGKVHWKAQRPDYLGDTRPIQDQPVSATGSFRVSLDYPVHVWLYFSPSGTAECVDKVDWSPKGQIPNFVFDSEDDAAFTETPAAVIKAARNERSSK